MEEVGSRDERAMSFMPSMHSFASMITLMHGCVQMVALLLLSDLPRESSLYCIHFGYHIAKRSPIWISDAVCTIDPLKISLLAPRWDFVNMISSSTLEFGNKFERINLEDS